MKLALDCSLGLILREDRHPAVVLPPLWRGDCQGKMQKKRQALAGACLFHFRHRRSGRDWGLVGIGGGDRVDLGGGLGKCRRDGISAHADALDADDFDIGHAEEAEHAA